MRKAAANGDMFLLFISTVVLMESRGDTSNQNCWSQAINIYNSFHQTVCQNTSFKNSDPNRWLPAVCKEICTVQTETNTLCTNEDVSVIFNLTNEMTSNFIVNDYTIETCSKCHQLRLVLITCKTDGITCTDCTNAKSETDISSTISTSLQTVDCSNCQNGKENASIEETSSLPNFDTARTWTNGTTLNVTCIQTGYLVLTSLLGLVFGILVTLGLWLIKTKFVKRKLCVSQSSSVRNNNYNIRQRSSDKEIPNKALTTELNTYKEKNTKTRDDIYNHLHETRLNSDLNDSPYDHAQCLTEVQSTRGNVLEDDYTHINTLR